MSRKPIHPGHLELINQRGREPIQPPRLLSHIQKCAQTNCEQLLAHLFSSTDDLFYDLSKRASSNQEQNLYFEAMREIRVRREGIANRYLRSLHQSFSELMEANNKDEFLAWDAPTEFNTKLSIVDGDDLEIDLARSNMISRTRDMYKEELYDLSMRLDHLLLQIEVDEDNNPLDPRTLTQFFIDACSELLDINIKAKLILFKLFEKHVLKQLGHTYAEANQFLMDAGILPKVPKNLDNKAGQHSFSSRQSATQESASTHTAPIKEADISAMPEFKMGYDALSLLLANLRQVSGQIPNVNFTSNPNPALNTHHTSASQLGPRSNLSLPGSPIINCYIYTGNPGPMMAAPELTNFLTQSQATFDQVLANGAPRNIVPDVIHQILAQKNPSQPQALEQNEENIINLVAMFFDQILSDEELPVEIQSIICRLQIPILKVALHDKGFFNNPLHPARQLVNKITELGLAFETGKTLDRDPIYRKMIEIVQMLNRQYKADDRIFFELLAELEDVVDKESKKSSVVEQRTAQTEAGKTRIKQAKIATQNTLYEKLKGVNLPEFIREFLTHQWLQVMVITYLKNGADSAEWVSNEQTVTDLIWISQTHDDARSLQRRTRLLPEILDRVEKGLEAAIDNRDLRAAKVIALEEGLRQMPSEPILQSTVAPLNDDQKEALGKGENAPKTWEEMTAVERQQAKFLELSSSFYTMAKNMSEGTWLDYFDENSGRQLRCKLTSKIDSETYLFVNRLGFKVLERTRKQFAYDMQFSRARLLDTRPFFDRIMASVVHSLSGEAVK